MNIQPKTIATSLAANIHEMNKQTSVLKLKLTKNRQDAEKLLKTDQPSLGYLCLAALSVFDDLPREQLLNNVELYLRKVQLLPHSTFNYYTTYCNCLIRLGMRETAYPIIQEYVNSLTDDAQGLRSCLEYTYFTGQVELSKIVIEKLEKLGKDLTDEKIKIETLSGFLNEPLLKKLLVEAGNILAGYGLIESGLSHEWNDDGFFYDLTVLPDSDESKVVYCDIDLSRLKVGFAQKHGLNLNQFILGCTVDGVLQHD